MLHRIHWHNTAPQPLWNARSSKHIEHAALAQPQQPSLMLRAGRSVAQLACAIAPHARKAWVLCGPGNNGGDGLIAAYHLALHGLSVGVHWLGTPEQCSIDTLQAWQLAQQMPIQWLTLSEIPRLSNNDVIVDALLGLGQRASTTPVSTGIQLLLQHSYLSPAHSLAVDLPTGLDTDHGAWLPGYAPSTSWTPSSRHTLSLLTLKTGLFTNHGRDACGSIWWDDLECSTHLKQHTPDAWLSAAPPDAQRPHNSHKGSFGDALIIGGAPGMTGAAILAASAALHHGKGRTLVHLLGNTEPTIYAPLPDLMLLDAATTRAQIANSTVVCGCGGGQAIRAWLRDVLEHAPRLILDADALNALASSEDLQATLRSRHARNLGTVLTPHPLEAARLLEQNTPQVQAQRMQAAQTLSERMQCTVLLKGSGSVIASPKLTPHINPTGNARLAIGGTGDVLAGLLAARWQPGMCAHTAATHAAWEHGALADQWPQTQALTASELAKAQLQSIHCSR